MPYQGQICHDDQNRADTRRNCGFPYHDDKLAHYSAESWGVHIRFRSRKINEHWKRVSESYKNQENLIFTNRSNNYIKNYQKRFQLRRSSSNFKESSPAEDVRARMTVQLYLGSRLIGTRSELTGDIGLKSRKLHKNGLSKQGNEFTYLDFR